MSEATRTGAVSKIEQQPGKRPWKATVGGRVVNFWPKAYQSQLDSDVHALLKQALESEEAVEVTGEESEAVDGEGNIRRRETGEPIMSFLAKDARLSPNGAPGASTGPQTAAGGRDPGSADFWQAMRWAYSLAADLLPREEGVVLPVAQISKLAGELFSAAYADALSKQEALQTQGTEDVPF